MKQPSYNPGTVAAYAIGILGTFLIMVFLVWVMRSYTRPAPLGTARAEERRKALAEINAADADALNHYGWVDQARGVVRLPISVAMELTIKEWRNPAAARSTLLARAEALAPAAPPAGATAQPAAGAAPAPGAAPGKTNEPAARTPGPANPGK